MEGFSIWALVFAAAIGASGGFMLAATCCAAGRADRQAEDFEPYDPEARP